MFQNTFQLNTVFATPSQFVSKRSSDFTTFLHQIVLVLAVFTTALMAFTLVKPELATSSAPLIKEEITTATAVQTSQASAAPSHTTQQRSVTNWLAKRYRVANGAAHTFVSAAYSTAKDFKLDPLLILSVMAIESGLNPLAESTAGAQGLMQVMSEIHQDKFKKFGGVKAALNPEANIRVGTQILKEYVTRGGSVEAGLKMYVGAALAENDGGYGSKVLAEYKRLKDVSSGKIVPTVNTTVSKAKPAMVTVNEARLEEKVLIEKEQISEHYKESELVAVI